MTAKQRSRMALPWPSKLIALFDAVDWESSDESELYGPFNALLDFYFPWEAGWNVVPHRVKPTQGSSAESEFVLLVAREQSPVLILQVKSASHIDDPGSRVAADQLMRQTLRALQSESGWPCLYGFSMLGPRLYHYELSTSSGTLNPQRNLRNAKDPTDSAPAHCWRHDSNILQDMGRSYFRIQADKALNMCSAPAQ